MSQRTSWLWRSGCWAQDQQKGENRPCLKPMVRPVTTKSSEAPIIHVASGTPQGQQSISPARPPRPPPWVKTTPHPPSLFSNLVWRARGAPNQIGKKRGDHFVSLTQGGARSSLALGNYLSSLQDFQFGSLRSHSVYVETKNSVLSQRM